MQLKKEALNMINERINYFDEKIENLDKIKEILPNTQNLIVILEKEINFLKSLKE